MTVLKMHDGSAWKAVSGPPGAPGTGEGGGGLDQATADTLYVNVNGDTMTGAITVGTVDQLTPALVVPSIEWADFKGMITIGANGDVPNSSPEVYCYRNMYIQGTASLEVNKTPTANLDAANKLYVDTQRDTRVPTTRTISTTAPLTGGGDLSANRTLAISNFSSGAAGAVPASGGGSVNYLRADGTWAAPPGTAPAASSETVAGIVELATSAEVSTGTDNTRAVHPAGLSANYLKSASARLTVSNTAPSSPAVNDVWIDTT